ncbi:hypothetical protein T492DRAFT_545479 [Pavlovales sp. CCMP2436]|nr:hypothetical protein T492DRAFT_545479 [Pavlovales sp. CCMP2436]
MQVESVQEASIRLQVFFSFFLSFLLTGLLTDLLIIPSQPHAHTLASGSFAQLTLTAHIYGPGHGARRGRRLARRLATGPLAGARVHLQARARRRQGAAASAERLQAYCGGVDGAHLRATRVARAHRAARAAARRDARHASERRRRAPAHAGPPRRQARGAGRVRRAFGRAQPLRQR